MATAAKMAEVNKGAAAAAASGAGAAGWCDDEAAASPDEGRRTTCCPVIEADVVVVGAGVSGLAAAQALWRAGLSVVVVEGRHRLGGRLHTSHDIHPDVGIDLGGAWIHGMGDAAAGGLNPIGQLALSHGFAVARTDYDDRIVYAASRPAPPSQPCGTGWEFHPLLSEQVACLEAAYEEVEAAARAQGAVDPHARCHASIADVTDAVLAAAGGRLPPAVAEMLHWEVHNQLEHYYAGSAEHMALSTLDERRYAGDDVLLPGGYGQVVDILATGLATITAPALPAATRAPTTAGELPSPPPPVVMCGWTVGKVEHAPGRVTLSCKRTPEGVGEHTSPDPGPAEEPAVLQDALHLPRLSTLAIGVAEGQAGRRHTLLDADSFQLSLSQSATPTTEPATLLDTLGGGTSSSASSYTSSAPQAPPSCVSTVGSSSDDFRFPAACFWAPGSNGSAGGSGGAAAGSAADASSDRLVMVEVRGARAVLTLPLGVLKAGAVQFDPPLAAVAPAKQHAIDCLGAAVYDKVVLAWPDTMPPFWDDVLLINRVPPPDEDPTHWSWFLNLRKALGVNILVAFNIAGFAVELEALPDHEVVARALSALRGLYGTSAVPDPTVSAVTRWGADPLARMSFTFIPLGATTDMCEALRTPVGDGSGSPATGMTSLHWAGEATSAELYATVHGAYETGLRAAAEIVQQLRPGQGGVPGSEGSGWTGMEPLPAVTVPPPVAVAAPGHAKGMDALRGIMMRVAARRLGEGAVAFSNR